MRNLGVGVIGLGNMGGGIARNFQRVKTPLAVWDIDPGALRPFERVKGVEVLPPGEMAGKCAAIIAVVPGSPEVAACLNGRKGILANARKGLVLYDLTTSDPAVTKRLARRAARKGVAYLDGGMSGGAARAAAGTLTLMLGGDAAGFRRTKRFLDPIAERVFHLGESGAGHTLKLIHNMVCHSIFMATCEGGRLAERNGIRLADMIDVFNVSNARSYASEIRFPRHILSEKWDAKSRVYNLEKDLRMAVALGRRSGAEVKHGEATHAFLEKAAARGMLDLDYSLLYRDFEKIRRVRLKATKGQKLAARRPAKRPGRRARSGE